MRDFKRETPILVLVCGIVLITASARATQTSPTVLGDRPVTANDLRAPRAQNSPVLAVDPTDANFVVLANRLDSPDFGCALHVSGDGGRTFIGASPVPELPRGADKCYGPEVAFDSEGTLYYLFVGLHGLGNEPMGVFLTSSSNRAGTFNRPRRILGPENYQTRMAIDDQDRVHLVWLHSSTDASLGGLPMGDNPILASHSQDGGKTFSDPIQVSDPERRLSVAPALAVGPDNDVHVVYYDLQDDVRDYQGLEGPVWANNWSLVSASSRDGGRSYSEGVIIDDQLVPPERVMLIFTMPPASVVADDHGSVFVGWHDARNGDWDVFVSRSLDSGGSWQNPHRLNDDRVANGRHQYLPKVAVAPNGRLDAIFYDRRSDRRNVDSHTYYTYSTDGGRSFAANTRLTSEPSDSRSGQHYLVPAAHGLADFGSRIALVAMKNESLAAWTDTRHALLAPYQDIFSTRISFPQRGATSFTVTGMPTLILGVSIMMLVGIMVRMRMRRRNDY